MRPTRTLALTICCIALHGCTAIGPSTVKRDRFDYNAAISESWQQQTLLNIVKLRYADMPVFVEVVSVVSGYQLEGSLNVGASAASADAVQGDILSFDTGGKYIDRPTITYQPITGSNFNKSFMTPIPPRAILFLAQTGWPVDLVYPLTVDAINGLRAPVAAGASKREGDSGFFRVIHLLREIQKSGAVGMHVKKKGADEATVMLFYRDSLEPEVKTFLEELYTLLKLDPDAREFTVVYGRVPQNRSQIAMSTLSMLQIIVKLAGFVDVPPEDVVSGRTVPSMAVQGRKLVNIHQGVDKPDSAFVAVRYRGRWFWIDDRDFASKRTFTFLMVLFSLTETGGREGLPLVTIPAS